MTEGVLRVDKWLWQARFFKSRTLAGKFVGSGGLRINGTKTLKAHHVIRVGDVLTFPLGPHIRLIKIEQLGVRRGPATEARTLYEDLDPPQPQPKQDLTKIPAPAAKREAGAGRPTKRERRETDKLRGGI